MASNAENVSIWWRHHVVNQFIHECMAKYPALKASDSIHVFRKWQNDSSMIAIFNKKTPSFHYINCNYQERTAIFMGNLHVDKWSLYWNDALGDIEELIQLHVPHRSNRIFDTFSYNEDHRSYRLRLDIDPTREVSGRFLFDVDTRISAIMVTSYLCQTAKQNHES